MQKATKLFKVDKFNHVLTATFLVYTSLLCALYAYLLFRAVHEIENQAAQIYLQNVHTEVLEQLRRTEKPQKINESQSKQLSPPSDAHLVASLIKHFKQSRPRLNIYSSLEARLPDYLTALKPGMHEHYPNDAQILVSMIPSRDITIYLVYDESYASNLDEHTPGLIVALSSVALLICLVGLLVSILLGKKIAEPLRKLAEEVDKNEPTLPLVGHSRADEIGTLSRNFTTSIRRAQQFLAREQQFSRHVSHELRTPVAIMSNCISLLKLENASLEAKNTAINRIDRATSSMSNLIETFLLLGRESESNCKITINLRNSILNELEKIDSSKKETTKTKVLICHDGFVDSEAALLGILINNLLRNALAYSASFVRITLDDNQLKIDNDIAEIDNISSSGFGYGTEIMNRIIESLDCQAIVEKNPQHYCVNIIFNH